MTGVDFSSAALTHARPLAQRTGDGIDFHEADVHDAVDVLDAADFGLVYTRRAVLAAEREPSDA